MSSNINANSINAAFPVIDENQPSQGFRDNFSAIKSNFVTASSEISNLQNTYITVTGDVISTINQPLYQENGEILLTLKLANNSSNGSGGTYDSSINGITCNITPAGTITNLNITNTGKYIAFDSNNIITYTKTNPDSKFTNYSSIKNITLSTISVDSFGKIISNGTKLIGDINLYGHYLPNNSTLIGNNNNISTAVTASNNNDVLLYDGTNLNFSQLGFSNLSNVDIGSLSGGDILIYDGSTWKPQSYSNGTVTNVTAGQGLKISNGNSTPEIDYDFGSLTPLSSVTGNELVIVNSGTNYNNISTSGLLSYINSNINADTSLSKLEIKTNKTISDTYILAYNSTLGTSYKLPVSSMNNYDNSCVFVSVNGSDTTGDGSYINPYRTINYTMTKLVSTDSYNIVLYSGTYNENITITCTDIRFYSLPGASVTISGGINYIVSGVATNLEFYNIIFNLQNGNISLNGKVSNIYFNDCKFYNNTGTDSLILNTSNSTVYIYDCIIDGNFNFNTNSSSIYVYDCISNTNVTFLINVTSSSVYISDIKNCGSISHISGELYLNSLYNINSSASITSTSSISTDIFSFKNSSLKNKTTSVSDTYCNFSKTGTCPYVFENLDFDTSQSISINGQAITYKNTAMQYPEIYNTSLPGIDSKGNETITSIDISEYNKFIILSSYVNCSVNLPVISTHNPNYSLDITLVFIPTYDTDYNGHPVTPTTPVTNITFNNVTWHPDVPVIDYTTNYQNIFKFTYIPGNSTWIGRRLDSPTIKIDPDSNNLLQKTSNGYLVELKAPADVTNQYVSSSTGSDVTGDGTQAKPFKTIKHAVDRIPNNTHGTIYLYYADTFNISDGSSSYVHGGTYNQINSATIICDYKSISFEMYGNSNYSNYLTQFYPADSATVDISDKPTIVFDYSKCSSYSYAQYLAPGFSSGEGTTLNFTQIKFKVVNADSAPVGIYMAPTGFNIWAGTLIFGGCDFILDNPALFSGPDKNTSRCSIILYRCYFDTSSGSSLIGARSGLSLKADFDDITTNSTMNKPDGTATSFKTKITNFNSNVANSNSFLDLNVISADARVYEGLITQNLIKHV